MKHKLIGFSVPLVAAALLLGATDLKKYSATITKKDARHNTTTFTDYCDAKSNSEAETIFKNRYPNDTVSAVIEVASK
jgi:hypothetical protein